MKGSGPRRFIELASATTKAKLTFVTINMNLMSKNLLTNYESKSEIQIDFLTQIIELTDQFQ